MRWGRRSNKQLFQQFGEEPNPNYEALEGTQDWAGLWYLRQDDMRWWRPQHFYFRSAVTGNVEQNMQQHHGPAVRPGLLRDVVHLEAPLAILRSHPLAPATLPPENEGLWTDTNPAWPKMSIDWQLGKLGLRAVWEDFSPDNLETFELIPDFAGEVTAEEAEPFDHITPVTLTAVLVYVAPGSQQLNQI